MINRAKILNHLAQVNHNSLWGTAIRTFVESAHNKSDDEVIDCVASIQSQMADNRPLMKKILGTQYEFFNRLKIPQPC